MDTSGSRRYFLLGMRLFFGVWLLYVGGFMKWHVFGTEAFIKTITEPFDKTWSPHELNVALAWLILIAEPAGALWLLSGLYQRAAWSCVALLMFLLTFGQTMLMQDASGNWHYVVLALACAALSEPSPGRAAP